MLRAQSLQAESSLDVLDIVYSSFNLHEQPERQDVDQQAPRRPAEIEHQPADSQQREDEWALVAMQERDALRGKQVGVIVSGQNIDRPWMVTVLSGGTPQA